MSKRQPGWRETLRRDEKSQNFIQALDLWLRSILIIIYLRIRDRFDERVAKALLAGCYTSVLVATRDGGMRQLRVFLWVLRPARHLDPVGRFEKTTQIFNEGRQHRLRAPSLAVRSGLSLFRRGRKSNLVAVY